MPAIGQHSGFGNYIENARLQKGIKSRAQLARRIGVTSQYMSDIEHGRIIPSEEKIQKLIDVLELDEVKAYKLADKLPLHLIEKMKQEYYGIK